MPAISLYATHMLEQIRSKIVDSLQARQRVAHWRSGGSKIVWTNGCFDLLHQGHIIYLAEARSLGDRLVVGLNSDLSVKLLKGETRPIHNLETRQLMLAAMASIDLVVTFEQATPLSLIEALKPDIIVKGGDYTPSTVVGGSEAKVWGGLVKILPFQEGHSTSSIIQKIKAI